MKFCKMQGTGNDFIVINNMEEKIPVSHFPHMAKRFCTHHLSLGADALMVADTSERGGDFQMRFYNADGSLAEMCGNGVRCLARFAYENGIAGNDMTIETVAGYIHAKRLSKRIYKTDLNQSEEDIEFFDIEIKSKEYSIAYIELGDPGLPHAIIRIDDLDAYDKDQLKSLGKTIRNHPIFPKGANVNFYKIMGENKVELITYERGVEDLTYACGTGSGATALTIKKRNEIIGNTIQMKVPGGNLTVEIEEAKTPKKNNRLYLTGETNVVAMGEIIDEDYRGDDTNE